MDVWTLAELKKASSAKRKGERSLKWQVRTSDGEQERSVGSVVKQKKTGSLAEVMVRFWCLWTQPHRIDPEIQCSAEERARCNKYPNDLLSALDCQGENQKPFSLPFHCILNMPHPAVTFLFGAGMNLIHFRSWRWSADQKHPPFFIGYFSYYEFLKTDNWRLPVLGETVTVYSKKINGFLIKYHTFIIRHIFLN